MIDAIRDAISRARSLGRIVNLIRTGNTVGVCEPWRSPRWRYIGRSHRGVRAMTNLDESKVIRIIRKKHKHTLNRAIANPTPLSSTPSRQSGWKSRRPSPTPSLAA